MYPQILEISDVLKGKAEQCGKKKLCWRWTGTYDTIMFLFFFFFFLDILV